LNLKYPDTFSDVISNQKNQSNYLDWAYAGSWKKEAIEWDCLTKYVKKQDVHD